MVPQIDCSIVICNFNVFMVGGRHDTILAVSLAMFLIIKTDSSVCCGYGFPYWPNLIT